MCAVDVRPDCLPRQKQRRQTVLKTNTVKVLWKFCHFTRQKERSKLQLVAESLGERYLLCVLVPGGIILL